MRNQEAFVLSPKDGEFAQKHISIRMIVVIEGGELEDPDARRDKRKQTTTKRVIDREMEVEDVNNEVEIGQGRRILNRRSSPRKLKPAPDQPIRPVELGSRSILKKKRVIDREMEVEDVNRSEEHTSELQSPC